MRWVRYLLLAASAGGAGWAIFILATQRVPTDGKWILSLGATLFVVNFFYLLRTQGRAFLLTRVVELWLEAKLGELQDRIDRAPGKKIDGA